MTGKIKQKNPGWLEKALKRHKKLVGKHVALGWPKGTDAVSARYPGKPNKNGTKPKSDPPTILEVAAWNNFGAPGIPRRDFMTIGAKMANEATSPIAKKGAKLINSGKMDVDKLLNKMGSVGAGEIQIAIRDLDSPPNSPITVRMKGSSNPLVDTGLMIQSVTWNLRKA